MDDDVSIRVGGEPPIMLDPHTTEDQWPSPFEAVGVNTLSDQNRHWR
jgi:hypothetical protein